KDFADHLGAGKAVVDLVDADWTASPADGPSVDTPLDAGDLFVRWDEFWQRDHRDADWLVTSILARRRAHAIYAGHKVGKSLLVLFLILDLLERDPNVAVIYLDYEMTEDDLFE